MSIKKKIEYYPPSITMGDEESTELQEKKERLSLIKDKKTKHPKSFMVYCVVKCKTGEIVDFPDNRDIIQERYFETFADAKDDANIRFISKEEYRIEKYKISFKFITDL